jgi:hypothetical protein
LLRIKTKDVSKEKKHWEIMVRVISKDRDSWEGSAGKRLV